MPFSFDFAFISAIENLMKKKKNTYMKRIKKKIKKIEHLYFFNDFKFKMFDKKQDSFLSSSILLAFYNPNNSFELTKIKY